MVHEAMKDPFPRDMAKQLKLECRAIGYEQFISKYYQDYKTQCVKFYHAFDIPLTPAMRSLMFRQLSSNGGDNVITDTAPVGDLEVYERQWSFLGAMLKRFCAIRQKLPDINTVDDVVDLLLKSKRILVLTGAGISVSCGIPDFRSENGLYHQIRDRYPDLHDPQLMFDIEYFHHDHRPFFDLARQIFPSNFSPSPTHRFIKLLESHGKLLRNYTQNIDTLEKQCGITRVVHCHGSFDTATCQRCRQQVDCDRIRDDIMNLQVPFCDICTATVKKDSKEHYDENEDDDEGKEAGEVLPIMKPDIVFFGEKLPAEFDQSILADRLEVDLMLVIGSSLKVEPVSNLVGEIVPHHVPLVLINKEPVYHLYRSFDVQLIGYCDGVVKDLCDRLEWDLGISKSETTAETAGTESTEDESIVHVPPHIYLYKGHKFDHERHYRIVYDDDSDEYGTDSDDSVDSEEEMPHPPTEHRSVEHLLEQAGQPAIHNIAVLNTEENVEQ